MFEPVTPTHAITTMSASDRLHGLVDRVAAGDRVAFRRLYTLLALRVWRDAVRALPRPLDARAVTRSTFVEVWHMARHHVGAASIDNRAWIAAITARRADDRLRVTGITSSLRDDHDSHTLRELSALLGRRPRNDPDRSGIPYQRRRP
ncbi:RNA polymerase sigma factor [Phytohabitans sp. LJ34]|uniref:RNA polymerase sigma factor n=1 Tax=Phytohabitans sp. LJ34 TaxID=3452217 RepID=UPI003F889F13